MSDLPDEEWRNLPGWEGKVQVSNMGRVRTNTRSTGGVWMLRKLNTSGPYATISLPKRYPGQHPQPSMSVHAAVALTWIGPRPDYHEVRHRNGDRHDNKASNIIYGLKKENVADDVENGTRRGEANGRNKLDEREVRVIKRLIAEGLNRSAIARAFEVSRTAITHIETGALWSHVAD